MFSIPSKSLKTVGLVIVLGYLVALDSSKARGLDEQQDGLLNYQRSIQQAQQQLAAAQQQQHQRQPRLGGDVSNLERLDDSDDDDEDDDRFIQQQLQSQLLQQYAMNAPVQVAGSDLHQADQAASTYQPPLQGAGSASDDLRTAASKHHRHHKHGAKGWLDMGAWTGKKGAFGWYDKHPVGKGK